MIRPLRINLAGGWYHVTARGNNRQAIYDDDREREQPGLKALRVRITFEDVVKAVEKAKRETWGSDKCLQQIYRRITAKI